MLAKGESAHQQNQPDNASCLAGLLFSCLVVLLFGCFVVWLFSCLVVLLSVWKTVPHCCAPSPSVQSARAQKVHG